MFDASRSTFTSLSVTTFEQTIEADDHVLRSAVEDLIAPYYEETHALLEREFSHCNKIYQTVDRSGRLIAFAMFAYEPLTLPGGEVVPSVYSGLSATRDELSCRGAIYDLWMKASLEIRKWAALGANRCVLWATTATPDTYFAARRFVHLSPASNGSYSNEIVPVTYAIRRKLGLACDCTHPFVLKGVACGTRYSAQERSRIHEVCQRRGFDLFFKLGVSEADGDRLLMVGSYDSGSVAVRQLDEIHNT